MAQVKRGHDATTAEVENVNKLRREEAEDANLRAENALHTLITAHSQNWRSYLTFPAMIFTVLRRDREEYRQLADRLTLHEFRQPRYTPGVPVILHHRSASTAPVSYEQQPTQLRRVIFAEEEKILSFVFVCDEFPRQGLAYVACVEHSGYGKNLIRPMLQAYAQYMAFTQPGVQLYIWADPPMDGNSFVFGKRSSEAPVRSRDYLYELYGGVLAGSGIQVKNFKPVVAVPPLPPYVAASEQALYEKVQRAVQKAEEEMRSLFQGTMVATLSYDPRVPKFPALFIPSCSVPFFDMAQFHTLSDFSTRERALDSTAKAKLSWQKHRLPFAYFPATVTTKVPGPVLLAEAVHAYVKATTQGVGE